MKKIIREHIIPFKSSPILFMEVLIMLFMKIKVLQFLEKPHEYISEKNPKVYKILQIVCLILWIAYFIATLIMVISGHGDGFVTSLILLVFAAALPLAITLLYIITIVQALISALIFAFFSSIIIWLFACLISLFFK